MPDLIKAQPDVIQGDRPVTEFGPGREGFLGTIPKMYEEEKSKVIQKMPWSEVVTLALKTFSIGQTVGVEQMTEFVDKSNAQAKMQVFMRLYESGEMDSMPKMVMAGKMLKIDPAHLNLVGQLMSAEKQMAQSKELSEKQMALTKAEGERTRAAQATRQQETIAATRELQREKDIRNLILNIKGGDPNVVNKGIKSKEKQLRGMGYDEDQAKAEAPMQYLSDVILQSDILSKKGAGILTTPSKPKVKPKRAITKPGGPISQKVRGVGAIPKEALVAVRDGDVKALEKLVKDGKITKDVYTDLLGQILSKKAGEEFKAGIQEGKKFLKGVSWKDIGRISIPGR